MNLHGGGEEQRGGADEGRRAGNLKRPEITKSRENGGLSARRSRIRPWILTKTTRNA